MVTCCSALQVETLSRLQHPHVVRYFQVRHLLDCSMPSLRWSRADYKSNQKATLSSLMESVRLQAWQEISSRDEAGLGSFLNKKGRGGGAGVVPLIALHFNYVDPGHFGDLHLIARLPRLRLSYSCQAVRELDRPALVGFELLLILKGRRRCQDESLRLA